MGIESTVYKLVLWLHILTAIIGFGTVFLNGVYAQFAKDRPGPGGLAISEAVQHLAYNWAEWFIYLVFIFGVVLVPLSDGAIGFDEVWISLSMGLFILALVISHGLHKPNLKKMLVLQRELVSMGPPPDAVSAGEATGPKGPPPQAVELEERGKRAAMYGASLNLLVLVILGLMIWKP